uniref:Uncharacterized protein n=1 Tax=Rhizophora mucronata TaxID=61149 RepID=A0A2P2NXJ8_RHIMU
MARLLYSSHFFLFSNSNEHTKIYMNYCVLCFSLFLLGDCY